MNHKQKAFPPKRAEVTERCRKNLRARMKKYERSFALSRGLSKRAVCRNSVSKLRAERTCSRAAFPRRALRRIAPARSRKIHNAGRLPRRPRGCACLPNIAIAPSLVAPEELPPEAKTRMPKLRLEWNSHGYSPSRWWWSARSSVARVSGRNMASFISPELS